jgi:hypothetical protein
MKMSSPVASDVRRVSNKYLVKIPTSGTCCVDCMALTTGVFDELVDLEYKTVNLKTPSEGTEIHWSFATVQQGSSLYQGAVYDFDTEKSIPEMAEDYYKNYYDKRNKGVYFVSSKLVADMYGKNVDESRIIYAAMPNFDAKNQTGQQDFLYPLCYVPGIKGSRVKYTTTAKLLLLDIGKLENVRFLWSITETLTESDKEIHQETLIDTLIEYDPDHVGPPKAVQRKSSEWSDPKLLDFLQDHAIPYVEKNYNIKLDGYIYNAVEGNIFHDEICLMDRSHLHLDSVEISPNTTYGVLPTIEEWKAMHSSQRVPNTTQRIDHVTLVSGVNRAFVGPHDKEDNNRDSKLLLSLDDMRYFATKQNKKTDAGSWISRRAAPFRAAWTERAQPPGARTGAY